MTSQHREEDNFSWKTVALCFTWFYLGVLSLGFVVLQEEINGTAVGWLVPVSKILLFSSYYISHILMPVICTYGAYKLFKRMNNK